MFSYQRSRRATSRLGEPTLRFGLLGNADRGTDVKHRVPWNPRDRGSSSACGVDTRKWHSHRFLFSMLKVTLWDLGLRLPFSFSLSSSSFKLAAHLGKSKRLLTQTWRYTWSHIFFSQLFLIFAVLGVCELSFLSQPFFFFPPVLGRHYYLYWKSRWRAVFRTLWKGI